MSDERAADGEPQESAGAVLSELLAKTIHISGLPDEGAVREFCEQFGAILGVTMVQKNHRGTSAAKSWAFVTFEASDDADEAICKGLSAAVPGKEMIVTLQSSEATWEATVHITGAVDVGATRSRELAAHAARVAVLLSGPTVSSEEEEEEGDEEEEGE